MVERTAAGRVLPCGVARPRTSSILAAHQLFTTRDLDEARTRIAERFCRHQLQLTSRTAQLDTAYRTVSLGESVSLNYLRYGDEVRITPGTFDDFFLVQIPLAGSARVTVGGATVTSDRRVASIGSPTEPVDMIWSSGCEQLLVYIRRDTVEQMAAADPARIRPVVFQPGFRLDSQRGAAWLRMVQFAVADIDGGGSLLTSELVAAHFEHTVIAGLLAAQASNSHAAPQRTIGTRAVRHVVALLEESPERPWRLPELAADVGVSVRSLQEGFRRELGLPLTAYLRRVRLRRARHDLLHPGGAETSVAGVAARWGFGHLGRFARQYSSEYDELPSQTLARTAS